MAVKLPSNIVGLIRERITEEADSHMYLSMSRTESGTFIDELVKKGNVGGLLLKYMPRTEVRTYIKDGVLNRYTKHKARSAKPGCIEDVIKSCYGFTSVEIEDNHKTGVSLFKTVNSPITLYIVVCNGTYLKWETALRKGLLFIPGKPFSASPQNVRLLLTLFAGYRHVTNSDKAHLESALSTCNACAFFYGES